MYNVVIAMTGLPYLFHPLVNKKNKICCISAGAAKGFYQLGALYYLYSSGYLADTTIFIGSSVGAAIACILAIGYDPIEFFSYTCTNDINECWKYDLSLHTILHQWGAIDHTRFKVYLEDAIRLKLGYIPTFEELYLIHSKCFICTSWCVNSLYHQTYFNPFETPNIKISDAVMASCALPGIFTKVYIHSNCYLDGGLFDRLPIYYSIHFCKQFKLEIDTLYVIDAKSTHFKVEKHIPTLLDYLKGMLYIPFFMQQDVKDTVMNLPEIGKHIIWIDLECEHSEITLTLDVKNRISNFCSGMSQAKEKCKLKLNVLNS